MQIVSTVPEVEELLTHPGLEYLLQELKSDNQLTLVSQSLGTQRLEELRVKVQEASNNVRIEKNQPAAFPFKPGRIQYTRSSFLKETNHLLLGKSDYLKFPDLVFESGEQAESDPYAIDLIIEKDTDDHHKEIKFPYETELHFAICKEGSRVNKSHRASVFISNSLQGTTCTIPSDFELVRSILMHRKRNRDLITLPISELSYSSAGQKLSAFYNLFDRDWSVIKQFLEERFWLQLFRYQSQVKNSAIPIGKGVFSYKDLENEIDGLYTKYREKVRNYRREIPEQVVSDDELDRYIQRCKKDAFTYYIKSELNYLIKRSGLFVGMKVKCVRCGSNKWYSLTELKDKLPCKGCNNDIIPDLGSSVYYKLSDTIVNNLLSDQTGNGKEFDGNYVVLKTLMHLMDDHQQSGNSFIWTPCLDFWGRNGESVIASDLDIVVIQNGKLIIGEAKCSASDFSAKVINSLVWAGNNLLPDKIIVSCRTGNMEKTVEGIKSRLTNRNPPANPL